MNPDNSLPDDTNADVASPQESVRYLLKTGAAHLVSGFRAAPTVARRVWAEQRPWVWLSLALFVMISPTLRRAMTVWFAPDSPLTFQPFVPLAVAALLWTRREQIKLQYHEILFLYGKNSAKRRGNLWVVGLGCVLLLISSITLIIPLGLFAIVLILIGTAYYLYGPFLLRPLLLPLSYLLLLTPPPGGIVNFATILLRYGSLLVAGQMLHFFFKNAQQQGAYVVFPAFVLQVSAGASGVTILLPLLAFALWLAIYRRIVIGSSLVLIVIAVAIVAFLSVMRLFLIGVIGALSSETGDILQSDTALGISSLLLGIFAAYLVYKIAVLLSPPRLI